MIEGHGFWRLPAAIKIARALEEYDIEWLEDMLLAHDVGALAELKAATTVPILASEYLVTRHQYLPVLQQRAADIIMLDPTWTGGITESHKIGALADTFGLPVSMHDCTGPFTLLAGVHLALAAPERDLPGDGPRLHPDLVPRRRPALRRDRGRRDPAADGARDRHDAAPRRGEARGCDRAAVDALNRR